MKLSRNISSRPGITLTRFEEKGGGEKFSGTHGARYEQTPEGPRIVKDTIEVRFEIFYGNFTSVKFSVRREEEYFDCPLTGQLDADTGKGTLVLPDGTKIIFEGYDDNYKSPKGNSLRLLVAAWPPIEKIIALALQRPRKTKEKEKGINYRTPTPAPAPVAAPADTGESREDGEVSVDDVPF